MTDPVLTLRAAALRFGNRMLWSGLDLDVRPGEFVAILGANGTGKSSLLKVILGKQRLSSGKASFLGQPVRRGNRRIGYVPQQRLADEGTPLRARDLLMLAIDGHRWGPALPSRARRARADAVLESIGASGYARVPIATLSGGEQQRLRVGQALADDPRLLLCDEPLLSLDLAYQRAICELIDINRREKAIGVLFVTHDINPILGMVDRVLYLAGGRFRIGTPDDVLRSDVLSELYGSPVEVIRTHGRVIVIGTTDVGHEHHDELHDPAYDVDAVRSGTARTGTTGTGEVRPL